MIDYVQSKVMIANNRGWNANSAWTPQKFTMFNDKTSKRVGEIGRHRWSSECEIASLIPSQKVTDYWVKMGDKQGKQRGNWRFIKFVRVTPSNSSKYVQTREAWIHERVS